jgi:chaperonin GroEL
MQVMEDIAIATGATLELGRTLDKIMMTDLGTCGKIQITADTTTIIEGGGDEDKIEARIAQIKNQVAQASNDFDREKLQERLARLTGGVAQIVVGGATETEVREKKDRIDDALHACRAAMEEGILPGGGVAVIRAAKALDDIVCTTDDERLGVDIIRKTVMAPLWQIAINTDVDPGVVIDRVKTNSDPNFGYNAATGVYGSMMEFGIICPAKVERVALQNAASIASLLLTTDCMISRLPEQTQPESTGLPRGIL